MIALNNLGSLTGIALRHLCANLLERLVAFPVQQETGPPAPSHCSSLYLPGRGDGFGLLFFLMGVSQKPGCL